jgi:DNA gyrase/topoisomerase IV subunit B
LNTYKSSDIKVLDELTHIRINPSMYIGNTETPTHLIEELIDNALDECMAGYANIIAIVIDTKNKRYYVADDGRGMPLDNNIPVTVSSKLFSGAKFKGSKTAYEIASGLHGCGLVAVNALSDHYKIEIYRNNEHAIFNFVNGKLKNKSIKPFTEKPPFSTKIEFSPTEKIFENPIPDINRIRRRLGTASAEMSKKITFILIVDGEKETFNISMTDYFLNQCLRPDEKILMKLIGINSIIKPEKFNVTMTYSIESTTPKILSSVNLLPVDSGGTHVNMFYEVLRNFFLVKGKKLGYHFLPNDTLVGLRAILTLSLKDTEFSGQSKEKLTNKKSYLQKLVNQLKTNLELFFNKNEEELNILLQSFSDYRAKLDAKKVKTNSTGKRASTKFTKLRDCSLSGGELFIVEGDSAGGGFIECRDPKKHAVLPLKGKIPNAVTMKEIIKNKEVEEMIRALGTGFGPEFNIADLRYDKIISATDADPDGSHIFCLTTMVLAIVVPNIIIEGHYYFLQTPLHAINEKKKFIPLWTDQELEDAKKSKNKISRFKGLGELNSDQLKIVAINESSRRLIPVVFTSDMNKMSKLFTSSEEKRKLLEGVW